MTLEEKLPLILVNLDCQQMTCSDAYKKIISICQEAVDEANDKIADIKNRQRELAGFMANDMQIIAMRYNTVVSTEAINMEFRKVFDKYFPLPEPKEKL